MNVVRRSHDDRAFHGVFRAWHAAWHAVVVAGGLAAELGGYIAELSEAVTAVKIIR